MAALMQQPRMALTASTSGRAAQPLSLLPLGSSPFQGVALSMRQQPRRERINKMARAARMFDDDEDDDYDSGVATMDDPEEGRIRNEYIAQWPNKQFIDKTLDDFPEAAVANIEQGRVLFSEGGYTYLDVRPAIEYDDIGKVRGSVNIPLVISTRRYDPESNKKKVVSREENPDFLKQVEKRFPDKQTKLLIGCSNGTQYSLDALDVLDEAGYENIVGLKGGFYSWFAVFDNKLSRRYFGEYAEQYTHDGDSCGIHSSGAGFDRSDKIEPWVPPEGY